MKTFDIEPHVAGEVRLGSDREENVIWAGRMAERGNSERIWFDAASLVRQIGRAEVLAL